MFKCTGAALRVLPVYAFPFPSYNFLIPCLPSLSFSLFFFVLSFISDPQAGGKEAHVRRPRRHRRSPRDATLQRQKKYGRSCGKFSFRKALVFPRCGGGTDDNYQPIPTTTPTLNSHHNPNKPMVLDMV